MNFQQAVAAAPEPVCQFFWKGKRALKREHRGLVICVKPRRFSGSIDLEGALSRSKAHANENLWDYGLGLVVSGHAERAIWVEVHPACTSEVETIVTKLETVAALQSNSLDCRYGSGDDSRDNSLSGAHCHVPARPICSRSN